MARFDLQELFSNAQALTASAASTSYIDFGSDRNIGIGLHKVCALIRVDVAADFTTGDETYTFALQTDDNSSFSSVATVGAAKAILASALTAGSVHVLEIPADATMERYCRLYATLAGTTPTVTITAGLTARDAVDMAPMYPAGYSVGS